MLYSYIKNILDSTCGVGCVLEHPSCKEYGHFATPVAFSLAKSYKKSPKIISEEIASKLRENQAFQKVETLNGYINLTLSNSVFESLVGDVLKNGFCAKAKDSNTILLEFVSANPTGPLHIGHSRGAVFGDALYRIGTFLGHKITREYYVNDAGAQIGMLGLSIYLAGRDHILGLKVEYPEEYYRGEYIVDIAKKAQESFGDEVFSSEESISKLALFGKNEMLEEIKDNLSSMGIEFDSFVSEANLYPKWDSVLSKMSRGTYEKDGKLWLNSSSLGDEKDRVIVRDNGEPTYLAGDIIYHNDKFQRGFDSYINIWGADHHGYIARVKAAISFLGFDESKLEVLLSQMVSLLKDSQPYKMSKRAGNFILMRDVVDDIGSDALRFIFLSKKMDTHLEFDVDDLKKQDSSNPIFYINYANARICTLIEKSTLNLEEIKSSNIEDINPACRDLLFRALGIPTVLKNSFEDRSIVKVCDFLKALSSDFHSYYNAHRVLGTPNEGATLKVFFVISLSITLGLGMLGIVAKDKM